MLVYRSYIRGHFSFAVYGVFIFGNEGSSVTLPKFRAKFLAFTLKAKMVIVCASAAYALPSGILFHSNQWFEWQQWTFMYTLHRFIHYKIYQCTMHRWIRTSVVIYITAVNIAFTAQYSPSIQPTLWMSHCRWSFFRILLFLNLINFIWFWSFSYEWKTNSNSLIR